MLEKPDEWHEDLQGIRGDFAGRGIEWATEVAFVEALLAVLYDPPTSLPENDLHQFYLEQVIDTIDQFKRGDQT